MQDPFSYFLVYNEIYKEILYRFSFFMIISRHLRNLYELHVWGKEKICILLLWTLLNISHNNLLNPDFSVHLHFPSKTARDSAQSNPLSQIQILSNYFMDYYSFDFNWDLQRWIALQNYFILNLRLADLHFHVNFTFVDTFTFET